MAFFMPSSIQKRLLRYALSRIQLFDTDALDLDRLDIGLGRRSNVELRDVALRKDELSKLLSLPQALAVRHASVTSLRLTIPADVYSSPISVRVKGITIELDVEEPSRPIPQTHPTRPGDWSNGGDVPVSHAHKEDEAKPLDAVIPSPEDLAKSFLQYEPVAEAAELEAELISQSVDLRQSATSTETEEDAPGYGTGGMTALPGFLAGFFAGVADRLEIIIEDVEIRLNTNVYPPSPPPSSKSITSKITVPLTLAYKIGKLEVQGVTVSKTPIAETSKEVSEAGRDVLGKRLVSLHDSCVQLMLKPSDVELLKGDRTNNKVPDGVSPTESYAVNDTKGRQQQQTLATALSAESQMQPESLSASADLMSYPFAVENTPEDMHNSFASVDAGDMADVEGEDELTFSGEAFNSRRTDRYSHEARPTDSMHSTLQSFRQERMPLDRRRLGRERSSSSGRLPIDSRLDPSTCVATAELAQDRDDSIYFDPVDTPSATSTPVGSPHNTALQMYQLAESKIFSHEEAASMYMSVFDEDKLVSQTTQRPQKMPGAWDEAEEAKAASSANAGRSRSDTEVEQLGMSRNPLAREGDSPRKASGSKTTSREASNIPDMQELTSQPLVTDKISPAQEKETFISKTFIESNEVRFWLPSLTPDPVESHNAPYTAPSTRYQGAPDQHQTCPDPRDTHIPGSFSTYAESANLARSQVNGFGNFQEDHEHRDAAPLSKPESFDTNIHIDRLSGRCSIDDLSLIAQITKKVRDLTKCVAASPYPSKKTHKASISETTSRIINLHATLNESTLAVNLRDDETESSGTIENAEDDNGRVLFLRLLNAYTNVKLNNSDLSQAETGIGKIKLDVGGQNVVRFDQEAKMNSSVRDTQILSGGDLSISYFENYGRPELNLATLPIVLEVDATKLDDTLNSIGGFSALLEMGSSVVSEATLDQQASPKAVELPRVRFETPPSPDRVDDQCSDVSLKMNVRLDGSTITLHAGQRAIRYNSTAIKAVVRDGGIGVQIDDSRLIGLSGGRSLNTNNASLRAHNLHLRYLRRPEEQDLTRLISLVTPSKDNFERGDGGVMVETLVRQRKNGAAARVSIANLVVDITDLNTLEESKSFTSDLLRLGAITKYLPEETRPGLLALLSVQKMSLRLANAPMVGEVMCNMTDVQLANVSAPSLLAMSVRRLDFTRKAQQKILHSVLPEGLSEHDVMLMIRLVGEELVPVVEIKLMNACIEYDVAVMMDVLGIKDSPHGVDALAASMIITPPRAGAQVKRAPAKAEPSGNASSSSLTSLKVDLGVRNCTIGLTPRRLPSKAVLVLSNARVQFGKGTTDFSSTDVEMRKAALLLTDDREALAQLPDTGAEAPLKMGQQIPQLCNQGYVSMCWVSAAHASVAAHSTSDGSHIDIEFDDQLFVLESCADSTNTLTELLAALQPPAPPSKGTKYQTEVTTVGDMMASFVGESIPLKTRGSSRDVEYAKRFGLSQQDGNIRNSNIQEDLGTFPRSEATSRASSLSDLQGGLEFDDEGGLRRPTDDNLLGDIAEDGLEPTSLPQQAHATASKWDSDRNRYVSVSQSEVLESPFKLQVKNMHIIWNLHDGYDWSKTRKTISAAIEDLETQSEQKRTRQRQLYEGDSEPEPVIGDFLFNSIYVGVPVNQDPRDITRQINRNVDDTLSETASHATTATDATPRPHRSSKSRVKKLKLERSQRHKITFELSGVSADMFVYSPGQETISSTDIRVRDFDIFDHVPTSTWKKFMTYMQDAGPREDKKPMMHIEVCNVKPVPDLLASELVMRVTVLPVRLHVDQDALDFMTRFFAFSSGDDKAIDQGGDQPYIQRVEVLPVPIKLDYKPKKVDYAGLRSGRTKEFMNFFNLDGADMILKHAIIYGCSSFERLHTSLEDIWMPDITTKQLPGVLAGLNGVRSLVNVGTGVRNLVTVPIQEYRKDGRIVRSISKGAMSFARTSGSELTRFGARLAIGAQTALQGAEDFLAKPRQSNDVDWETADLDEEEKRAFSNYADQPTGILQGLKGAAKSLERDLLLTRDVIVAISGEARESGSMEGAARAVARHAPTIILRPMIGASKAVSQTLMGATNTVDPQNRRRLEDKYKRY